MHNDVAVRKRFPLHHWTFVMGIHWWIPFTSWYKDAFRITGSLWRESTNGFSSQMANNMEFLVLLWKAIDQTVEFLLI